MEKNQKNNNEIKFSATIAQKDTETIWGWGTPAGKLRAFRRAQLIIEGAGLKAGDNILEIGCGTGMFTEIFAKTGAKILALDISPDLLVKARQRGLPQDQVFFVEKPFEAIEETEMFDAVIGSSILHHLDIKKALEKIFFLLRPGGVFSFAEPNFLNPQVFLERKLRFLNMFSYISPDETAFVRWEMDALLREKGFEEIVIKNFDWLHPSIPEKMIKLIKEIEPLLERTPFIRDFSGSLYICAKKPW
ncbi:MAG TPA: methyltransferase domain-containing protein [Candidatus Omnitrophota bacterium]|nr:methyltransferase domain-containing protein [Candidatus Omnitrophota bacterium]